MIPLSDDNPTLRTPIMTWLILGAMFAVWLVVQGGGMSDVQLATTICNLGMVPGELTHMARIGSGIQIGPNMACVVDSDAINILTPITSMFLHASWGHILGNALYFWVFGNNIEDSMGPGRFLVFYLICGLVAAAAQVMTDPASPVPTVGASGAISGILGAYVVLYPNVRVNTIIPPIFFYIFRIRAWIMLIWWFALQVLTGLPQLSTMKPEVSGGVAVFAHIGGFIAGAVLVKLFENPRLVNRRNALREARLFAM